MDATELADRIARALEGEPVVAAYLHGSRAAGTAREDSYVDVAVLPANGAPRMWGILDLEARLRDAVAPLQLDLLDLSSGGSAG